MTDPALLAQAAADLAARAAALEAKAARLRESGAALTAGASQRPYWMNLTQIELGRGHDRWPEGLQAVVDQPGVFGIVDKADLAAGSFADLTIACIVDAPDVHGALALARALIATAGGDPDAARFGLAVWLAHNWALPADTLPERDAFQARIEQSAIQALLAASDGPSEP